VEACCCICNLRFNLYCLSFLFIDSLPPHNPRSRTCAYVMHMKDNVSRRIEIRQVIHDTRISNGQWPLCDVTNLCGSRDCQGHTKTASGKTYTCQKKSYGSILVQTYTGSNSGKQNTCTGPGSYPNLCRTKYKCITHKKSNWTALNTTWDAKILY
jgi:hypothetical protein